MTCVFHFRATQIFRRLFLLLFLAMISSWPYRTLGQAPQSPDAPPQQQQPAADPSKMDSPVSAPNSPVAQKPAAAKPHRVFTNDDISSAPAVPVPPGARRRLKQLNRCDRACFVTVEKQALNFGYRGSSRREMEDRLASYIEGMNSNPKWQQLLLDMISAHINACTSSQHDARRPEDSPNHTPTREEILAEEEAAKNYRPPPPGSYQAATSALMSYRWSSKPDPLKASWMIYQYLDEIKRDCSTIAGPVYNSADDSDDP